MQDDIEQLEKAADQSLGFAHASQIQSFDTAG
jgi:hypothetical protein